MHTPTLPAKVRLLPVYTKTKSGHPNDFEVSLFAVDQAGDEVSIFNVPKDTDKPWPLISKLPFAGDTRLSCIYVPGKPEPLLMAGSPTERMQKLCHLNLIEWCAAKRDERLTPPKAPVVEEKFSRQMASLWPENREGHEGQVIVALPIDCTADLPVSRHAWVNVPIVSGGDFMSMHGPPDLRPPFDYGPPFPGHPPFDPRGPPPFDLRPPPFGRIPFDDHCPPFDGPLGKGHDPHRPPFDPRYDRHPGGGWFDGHRPPFDRPLDYPRPFGDCRPPFDARPPLEHGFDDRPPHFDGPSSSTRPPFEAPPGDWYNDPRPPFDAARDHRDQERRSRHVGPGTLEIGSMVEANFREQNQWMRAKVIAIHEDGTFDVEYEGDYIEWHVPLNRVRPLPPLIGQFHPPGAPDPSMCPSGTQREGRHRRRRHHGEHGEHGEHGDGGQKRHHGETGDRERKHHGEQGDLGNLGVSARKRHHHHRHAHDPEKKERSQSQDGKRKHRKLRHGNVETSKCPTDAPLDPPNVPAPEDLVAVKKETEDTMADAMAAAPSD